MRMQSLVSENDAANPEGGVLENVPSTVVAPVPGPPDFNGASAVVARLPNIGFAPSLLTEKGFETRGSFTIRKSRAGESFYLRVYGKLNHNIRCTLRGYRNLMGDFTGNTIYTGFKKIYTGKSQLQTGHIPRGIVGEVSTATAMATLPVTRRTLVGCWGWKCRFSHCRFLLRSHPHTTGHDLASSLLCLAHSLASSCISMSKSRANPFRGTRLSEREAKTLLTENALISRDLMLSLSRLVAV